MACRRHHCLQTLLLLFEFETKESLVSGTNALLVGPLISTGDDSVIKLKLSYIVFIIDQTEENFAGENIITAHA